MTCTSRSFFPAAASPCLIAEQSPAALQQSDHFHHPSHRKKLVSCRKATTSFPTQQFTSQTDYPLLIMNTVSSSRAPKPVPCANRQIDQIGIVRHTHSSRALPIICIYPPPRQGHEPPTPGASATCHEAHNEYGLTCAQLRLGNPNSRRRRRLLLRQTQHKRGPRRKSRSRPPKTHPPL